MWNRQRQMFLLWHNGQKEGTTFVFPLEVNGKTLWGKNVLLNTSHEDERRQKFTSTKIWGGLRCNPVDKHVRTMSNDSIKAWNLGLQTLLCFIYIYIYIYIYILYSTTDPVLDKQQINPNLSNSHQFVFTGVHKYLSISVYSYVDTYLSMSLVWIWFLCWMAYQLLLVI